MKMTLVFAILLSFSAFAANQDEKTWNLDYIKLGCTDPGAVHNQIPPTDIKITCKQMSCDWVPGPSTFGSNPTWKKVCGGLMTNKPNLKVPKWCWGLPAEPTPYSCPTFKEEMSETEMVFNVTCEEVIAMTSIKDFCASRMALEIEANESILTVTQTGKTVDMCAAAAGTVHQK